MLTKLILKFPGNEVMTRIYGYHLLACPLCQQIHRKITYSSINMHVNPDFFNKTKTSAQCMGCGRQLEFKEMISLGSVPLNPLSNGTSNFKDKLKRFFTLERSNDRQSHPKESDWEKYPII